MIGSHFNMHRYKVLRAPCKRCVEGMEQTPGTWMLTGPGRYAIEHVLSILGEMQNLLSGSLSVIPKVSAQASIVSYLGAG